MINLWNYFSRQIITYLYILNQFFVLIRLIRFQLRKSYNLTDLNLPYALYQSQFLHPFQHSVLPRRWEPQP